MNDLMLYGLLIGLLVGAIVSGLWIWFVYVMPARAQAVYWRDRTERFKVDVASAYGGRRRMLDDIS